MIIDIPDDEYPELVNYLSDAKRKMKFLYFLETSFEENGYDPTLAGIRAKRVVPSSAVDVDLSVLTNHLDSVNDTLRTLTKNLDGACIGRFPVEHVVHETVAPVVPKKAKVEEDEIDYSDTTGIDFSAAIAMFEE